MKAAHFVQLGFNTGPLLRLTELVNDHPVPRVANHSAVSREMHLLTPIARAVGVICVYDRAVIARSNTRSRPSAISRHVGLTIWSGIKPPSRGLSFG
jgi:hypothetical protein